MMSVSRRGLARAFKTTGVSGTAISALFSEFSFARHCLNTGAASVVKQSPTLMEWNVLERAGHEETKNQRLTV